MFLQLKNSTDQLEPAWSEQRREDFQVIVCGLMKFCIHNVYNLLSGTLSKTQRLVIHAPVFLSPSFHTLEAMLYLV